MCVLSAGVCVSLLSAQACLHRIRTLSAAPGRRKPGPGSPGSACVPHPGFRSLPSSAKRPFADPTRCALCLSGRQDVRGVPGFSASFRICPDRRKEREAASHRFRAHQRSCPCPFRCSLPWYMGVQPVRLAAAVLEGRLSSGQRPDARRILVCLSRQCLLANGADCSGLQPSSWSGKLRIGANPLPVELFSLVYCGILR